jgi:hypothetical protein
MRLRLVLAVSLLAGLEPISSAQSTLRIEIKRAQTVSFVASSGISSTSMSANVILPDGSHAKVTCLSGFDRCGPIESFRPELLPPDSKKCIDALGADGNSAVVTCTTTELGFYDATREGNKLLIAVPSGTVQYHIDNSW